MSRHLFTSDLHLGHERVAGFRGFSSVEEHDDAILGVLRTEVTEGDVLWLLGDLVGSAREWERALHLLDMLPGRKRLVLGNHDPAHPMNRNAWKHTARLAEVVEWAGTSAQVRIGGRDVVLSHFPYTRDREATRYPQWRLPNVGTWLLHGHTHGEERVTRRFRSEVVGVVPETYGFRHRYTLESEVHVGWDAWKRPVADYEVAELIRTAEEAERV